MMFLEQKSTERRSSHSDYIVLAKWDENILHIRDNLSTKNEMSTKNELIPVLVIIFGSPIVALLVIYIFHVLWKAEMKKKKKRTNSSNLNHVVEMQSDGIPSYDDDNDCEVQEDNLVPQYKLHPDETDDLGYYDERGEFHFNNKFDQTSNYEKNRDDGQNVGENSTLANNFCLPKGGNGIVAPFKVVTKNSTPSADSPTSLLFDSNQLGRQERGYSSNQTNPQLPYPARTRTR